MIRKQRWGVVQDERKGHEPRAVGDLGKLEKKSVLFANLHEGCDAANTLISDC